MTSVWETLSHIDVNQFTEKKGKLTYLSWAWAWGKVKETYPQATYEKKIWSTELPYTQDDQGFAYVQVSVQIEDQSLSEVMPVLDHRSDPVKNPTNFQVNTSLQRCLAKCCAMHGLGHYIYAGEDLPPDEDGLPQKQPVLQEEPVVVHEHILSLLDVARNNLDQYDLKALDHWMEAAFTMRWMDVAKKKHPEIHQEVRAACVARKKKLEKEAKEKNG